MKRPKQKAWKPAEHSARKGPGAQERRNRGGAWIAGGLLPAEAIYEPRRLEFGSLSPGNATQCVFLKHGNRLPPPLFILAPPRSFTSLVCAMLRKAKQWLRLRSQLRTDLIFRILADKVYPLILVDKSPSIIYDVKVLRHLQESFPRARFIHLLRHPRGHGESVMRYIQERSKYGPIPPTHWLLEIVSYPPHTPEEGAKGSHALDPQYGWYALNKNICDFLISVPGGQKMQIRGEDLLTKPAVGLRQIVTWLGLRTGARAIQRMMHPERSAYAYLGPPGARYGNDAFFLADPALRPSRAEPHSLDGALSWRTDGQGFSSEVKRLAEQFGYT